MIELNGAVRLVDLGCVGIVGEEGYGMAGSPWYAAPEQFEKDYQVAKLFDLNDAERNYGSFKNPFGAQVPFIRIEAMLSTLKKNPMVILPLDENKDLITQKLEVKYGGKSIAEVLDMTVAEAYDFFAKVPRLAAKLKTLVDVGLGYIGLGQSATTLSGGEALAQAEFCTEILRLSKKAGLHTAIETSGYAPLKIIESVEPYIDLWLYDIKLLDPASCLKYTGRPLKPVLDNIRHLNAAKRRIVMRCPMVPGINDGEAELKARGALANELDSVEAIDVLPYVPYGVDKAQRLGLKVYEAPTPPKEYGPGIVAKLSKFTRKPVRIP